jgi:hypothetical protein
MKLRFEGFTAVMIHAVVLWSVTACSLVGGYQHFRETCCLHFGEEGGDSISSEMLVLPTRIHHVITQLQYG